MSGFFFKQPHGGGNRNPKFFHKMVNAHRRRNCMSRIKINELSFLELYVQNSKIFIWEVS